MPLIEIDETELANYRSVSTAVNAMLKHPEARKRVLEAQKLINPDAVIPEIDAAKPFMSELEKTRAEIQAMREAAEADKVERDKERRMAEMEKQWNKGRSKLRESGYTADAITKIEALMEEKGVADHEIAASYFDKLHPTPEPVSSPGNRMNIFGDMRNSDVMKPLMEGHEDVFLQNMVNETLGRRVI